MGRIRNSAKALIIKDGKMAAIKIRDAGEEWYIMPGGGQEAEETLRIPLIIAPKPSTSSPLTKISRKSAIQAHYLHTK